MNINIQYGGDSMTKYFDGEVTVGQVIEHPSVRAQLGYGDNVRATVGGIEQPKTAYLSEDDTLVVETRCNSKAAAPEAGSNG